MSGWDDVVIEVLQAHTNNEAVRTRVTTGIDAYNAKTVTTRKSLTFWQVKKEWKTNREKLIQALNDLPDENSTSRLIFRGVKQGW